MTVVDASVAVKWFVMEALHNEARRLLDEPVGLLAPELLPVEVANVAWKKVRLGELRGEEATRLVAALLGGVPVLRPLAPVAPRALALANELDHSVYDCVYLALALEEESVLVTADRRFHEVVGASGYAGATTWLGGS